MSAENQKTILLVEDEVVIAMVEKFTLEKFGYNVIMANSGEEAVATFEKTPSIDLILMDIELGVGIDGTEAAAIILRQRDLPVVFLSSHTEPEVVAKTEKITSYGYVVKNSSNTVLDASIKMAFKLFAAIKNEKEKESQMEAAIAALRESEARLAEAQAVAKVGSWETDLANLNVIWSEETYRIFEIDPGSFHLTQASFLVFTHPEDCAKVDAAFLGSLDTRSLNAIEHRIVTPGGLVKFIEERWRIFQDDQGRPIRAVGTCQDITERKQAEEAIFQSKKDWEDCFDSITDMITIHDNDYNIVRANKAGKALLKLPALEKHLQTKCFSFYHGSDAPPAGCPSCDCLKSGMPGVFELFEPYLNRYLEIRAIPRFDSHNQRAGLIHIVRDITERKREESQMEAALAELRESEQRLNFHVNNSPLATIEWTTDFIVTRWSVEAEKIFGWNQSETIGKPMMDLQMIYNEDIPLVQKTMERLSDGSSKRIVSTNRNYTKEGKVIICEWYNSVLLNPQGKMISVMSQAMDITERKRVEEALRASEEKLRVLFEQLPIGVSLLGKNRKITYVNPALEKILDISKDDLLQEKYQTRRYIRPDGTTLPPEEFASVRAFKEQKLVRNIEIGVITESGKTIWTSVSAAPFPMVTEGLLIVTADITERKQAESQREAALEALRESEEKYRTLVERANEAIIIVQDGVFVFANRRMSEFLGVPAGALEGKPFIDFVWPEDRELVSANYRKRIAGEPVRDAYDFRIIGVGGRLTWVLFSAAVIQWKGKPATLNLLTDITDRKQAEEEIKRQLAEKEIILKEVHHRIKNNIASIGSLLSLHSQSTANPEAIAVLQDAIGRVNSMRILYDKLLLSEGYKDISVKSYVESLVDSVVSMFPGDIKIKLDKRIADFHLDSKQLFPLGIIINELLTNIMKYAFINRDNGLIKISLSNVDGHVTLTIQDNGIGLPAGFDINESEGFGLKLVKMLSQQLGGSFSIKKHAGTRCIIEFNV